MPYQSLKLDFKNTDMLKMNFHVSTAVAQLCSEFKHVQNHYQYYYGLVEVSTHFPLMEPIKQFVVILKR